MSKIICIYNQKGGVGKTTTVINLSSALGLKDKKVLILDMDPQGNSSSGLGVDKNNIEYSIYDFLNGEDINNVLNETSSENVYILPSNASLAGFEIEAVNRERREYILKERMEGIDNYDYIIIDCPPSIGLLSLNSLCASDSVLIPIQTEYYALEGVSQLIQTITMIQGGLNKDLEIEGVLLSMYDGRTRLSLEVLEETKKYFKDKVFKTVIPRNVTLAEAPSYGESIFNYDNSSRGAKAYEMLSREILKKNEEE